VTLRKKKQIDSPNLLLKYTFDQQLLKTPDIDAVKSEFIRDAELHTIYEIIKNVLKKS
jgi:hypothetical protein